MTSGEFLYNLSGCVRHQGLPVAGVSVVALDKADAFSKENALCHQITNARGEFSCALKAGIYRLEFTPNPTSRFLKYKTNEINVFANTTCNINLITGVLVSGSLKTNKNKLITSGNVITTAIEPIPYTTEVSVATNGTYNLVVPRGKYHLAYRSTVADAEEMDLPCILTSDLTVLDVTHDLDFDLTLPELFTFTGEVVETSGHIIANALVTIKTGDFLVNTKSNEEGKFQIQLQSGSYDLEIEPPANSVFLGLKENGIEVRKIFGQKFVLAEGFRLRGQVAYEKKYLSDCSIHVFGPKDSFRTKTNAEGQFQIGLPQGNYTLIASARSQEIKGMYQTPEGLHIECSKLAPWSKAIVVGRDTHVAIKLQEGTICWGRVTDEVENIRIGVKISVFGDADFKIPLTSGITSGEGIYCFTLLPGSYWLVVQDDTETAKKIEVGEEPLNFDINWQGWCQIAFEVAGEDGTKIPYCRLRSRRYMRSNATEGQKEDESFEHDIVTDEEGVCRAVLPIGIYSFEFNPPTDGSYANKLIKQLSISTDLTRKITLTYKN